MKNKPIILSMILASLIFIIYHINDFWGTSGDIAQHYGLSYRMAENLSLIKVFDPSIGIMTFYPPFGHAISSILGIIFHSNFLGMQVTTLCSIALIWSCIFYILSKLPRIIFLSSASILIILIFINSIFTIINIHGGEIIGNYFYGQLIGQAILFLIISFAINFDYENNNIKLLGSLLAGLLIVTCTHLLPAFQILGIIALILVDKNIKFIQKGYINRGLISVSVLFILLSITSVLTNPWYRALKNISNHNGELEILNISYPLGIILLSISSLSLGLYLYFISVRKSGMIALKYFGFYGIITGILCLLQVIFLVFFSIGSEYSVKKYIFALNTSILISISIIFGNYIGSKIMLNSYCKNLLFFSNAQFFIMPVAIFFLLNLTVPFNSVLDVSKVMKIEQQLIVLKNSLIQEPEAGKSNIVISLDKMLPAVNWMFSMAIFKTPFERSVSDAYLNKEIKDFNLYSSIISDSSGPMLAFSGCNTLKSSMNMNIYSGECVSKFLINSSSCKNGFDLTDAGFINSNQIGGFSIPEKHGRWTLGSNAKFSCLSNGVMFSKIMIKLIPFVHPKHDSIKLIIDVNNIKKYEKTLSNSDFNESIVLNLDGIKNSSEYSINFLIANPFSPKDVGLNSDTRKIGVSVSSIKFN